MCFIRFLLLGAVRVDPDTETALRRTKKTFIEASRGKKQYWRKKLKDQAKLKKKKKILRGEGSTGPGEWTAWPVVRQHWAQEKTY